MALTNTGGRIYLMELLPPFERMELQFVPEGINIARSANVAEIAPVGRNNPIHHYTGGTDTLKLRVSFYADEADRQDVARRCRWLMSLAMNDGGKKPQPRVKLVMGELFQRSKWIVRNVNCDWQMFEKGSGFFPRLGYADIQMVLDTDSNVPQSDLRPT